jgi:hypothetical protein
MAMPYFNVPMLALILRYKEKLWKTSVGISRALTQFQ